MKSLFTFVLDFKGGTYVSQIEESSINKAIHQWIMSLDLVAINVKRDTTDQILQEFKDSEKKPSLLTGMKNAWCITLLLDNKLALVNIIKTNKT